MKINEKKDGNSLILQLEGRLDTVSAPELEEHLNKIPESVTDLIFNLAGLKYMSSAGLRLLLAAQKRMAARGSMKVTHVNDVIMEIFEVTGFTDLLTIEKE